MTQPQVHRAQEPDRSPSEQALALMREALALLDQDDPGVAAAYLQLAIEKTEARLAIRRS